MNKVELLQLTLNYKKNYGVTLTNVLTLNKLINKNVDFIFDNQHHLTGFLATKNRLFALSS